MTTDKLEYQMERNFGRRLLSLPFDECAVGSQLAGYDAADAGQVSYHVRQRADLDLMVQKMIELYRQIIQDWKSAPPVDRRAELREFSRLLAYCDRSKSMWQTNYDAPYSRLNQVPSVYTVDLESAPRQIRAA